MGHKSNMCPSQTVSVVDYDRREKRGGGRGRGSSRGGRGGGSMMSRTCHTCHGVGHSAKYCVKGTDGNSTCFTCGGTGHKSTVCPTTARLIGGPRGGAGVATSQVAEPKGRLTTEIDVLSVHEALTPLHTMFIVDSGACTHLCYDRSMFVTYHNVHEELNGFSKKS